MANSTLTVTEDDNDTPGLTLSASILTVVEGASNTFTVRLSDQPTGSVTVAISSDNSDAAVDTDPNQSGNQTSLTFTTVNWNQTQQVTVHAAQDDDGRGEPATLTLDPGGANYADSDNSTLTVSIQDDDPFGITVSATSLTVAEGSSDTFTVRLATLPAASVTVAVADGSSDDDVTLSRSSLSFSTTNWKTPQTVRVSAAHDADTDDDSATITLRAASSDSDYDAALAAPTVAVTVTDDDESTPGLTVTPSSLEVDEGSNGTFTVELATEPTAAVTVALSVSGDDDVTLGASSLTFSTTNWDTAQIVTVSAAEDDDATDGSATVTLDPASTDTGYGGLADSTLTVTEDDNDVIGLTVSESSLGVLEGGSNIFTVQLATKPTGAVTVDVSSDDTDVTVDTEVFQAGNQTSVSFTTANWNTPKTVTVAAAEDSDSTNDTATLTLDPSGADYASVADSTIAVSVTDNDNASALAVSEFPSGYYLDSNFRTRRLTPVGAGDDIYVRVSFNKNVGHTAGDGASARPEIFPQDRHRGRAAFQYRGGGRGAGERGLPPGCGDAGGCLRVPVHGGQHRQRQFRFPRRHQYRRYRRHGARRQVRPQRQGRHR